MKVTKLASLTAIAIALTLSSGCKHKPVGVTQIPNGGRDPVGGIGSGQPIDMTGTTGTTGTGVTETGIPSNPPGTHVGWKQDTTTFAANMVHFAYDSSVIRAEDKSKIATVADHMKSNPSEAVEVDGHCDERGTDEYNRALGERRALAIREELVSLGIDPTRVDTRSYGRERPIDTGHSEAAHAKNRRGEFILLTPP